MFDRTFWIWMARGLSHIRGCQILCLCISGRTSAQMATGDTVQRPSQMEAVSIVTKGLEDVKNFEISVS